MIIKSAYTINKELAMIGFYTHIYFASKVTEGLPIGSSQVIKLYPDAFRLGLLGTDILDGISNVRAELDSVHSYDLFASSAEYILGSGSKCQLSYMLGMICHYLLDSRLKPYIYYVYEHGVHHYFDEEVSILDLCDIENSIDYYIRCSHMISQMDEIKSFKARGFVVEDIIDLYVNGINPRCLGYVVEAGQIRTQFNSFTFRDPVPKDMLTNDYMNTKRRPWQQVRNEYFETNVSLEQMFDKITPIAQKMIKDYMASARSDYPLTRKAFLINANGVKTK